MSGVLYYQLLFRPFREARDHRRDLGATRLALHATSRVILNIYTRFCSSAKKCVARRADAMRRWPRRRPPVRRRHLSPPAQAAHRRVEAREDAAHQSLAHRLQTTGRVRAEAAPGPRRRRARFFCGDRGRGGVAPWPRRRVGPRCGFWGESGRGRRRTAARHRPRAKTSVKGRGASLIFTNKASKADGVKSTTKSTSSTGGASSANGDVDTPTSSSIGRSNARATPPPRSENVSFHDD